MDFHGLFWLIVFALAVRYGLPWLVTRQRQKRLAASGIADIDRMDGKAFEQYLEVLFRSSATRCSVPDTSETTART